MLVTVAHYVTMAAGLGLWLGLSILVASISLERFLAWRERRLWRKAFTRMWNRR